MTVNPSSQYARERMVEELASDETFLGYDHTVDEVAQVVAGLARAAGTPMAEYIASPDDVAAVAELTAFHLGLDDYVSAGVVARSLFNQTSRIAS